MARLSIPKALGAHLSIASALWPYKDAHRLHMVGSPKLGDQRASHIHRNSLRL